MASVRIFMKILVYQYWKVHQMNIQNTLLHGEIGDTEEEFLICFPPGFRIGYKSCLCTV